MKHTIITIIILSLGIHAHTQTFSQQRGGFIFANMALNGFTGGIGALINKNKGEKPFKVFIKGFGQGCLGSAFQLAGRDLTWQIRARENISWAWAARLTNAIGCSITQNAASNINFWERWHFNLGVLRFDYYVPEKKFQARFFPSSLYGIIDAVRQAIPNVKMSLQTGILIYERYGLLRLFGSRTIGIGVVSSIAIDKNINGSDFYDLMAHETMHILQYDSFVWINPLLFPLDKKWKQKSNIYQTASKYVYFDLNGLTLLGLYVSQLNRPWECIGIERVADHFSNRVVWPRCN